MPPVYDYKCKHCGKEHGLLMSYAEYDNWTSQKCEGCDNQLSKDDRVFGKGLKTSVIGVKKGGYGSKDWT